MIECCIKALKFFEDLGKHTSGLPHPNYFEIDSRIYPEDVRNWLKSLKERLKERSDKHYELEEFAKIIRGNLTGISKAVQSLFEDKYFQLTGNKMYRGYND
jgi:hypothetical protein